jgi:hypothetical protein
MAKISPSSLINGASGAVGSIVFSRNRGGFYSRSRVTPANPSSTRQVNWRTAFKAASQRWSLTLTESQRQQWRTHAQNLTRVNRLGMPIPVNGFNAFVEADTYAEFLGTVHPDAPPTAQVFPVMLSLSIDAAVAAHHFNVHWAADTMTSGIQMFLYASNHLPAGRNAPDGTWAYVNHHQGTQAQPQNDYTIYTTRFPTPVAGQKTFLRARVLYVSNYTASPWLYAVTTWSA